ncbi:MAG: VOC family protein [Armatimonadota bacterium]|nr:VOC family protein [Armatimonadota bacterium]
MATLTLQALGSRAGQLGYDGGLTCTLGVTNLNASIAWFEDVLGFELEYKLEEMGWCELKTPTSGVGIGLSQVEAVKVGGGSTMVFGVKDIDHARKELEAKDVKFDGETMTIPEMVRLCTFFDPDGNTFMLYQSLSQQ